MDENIIAVFCLCDDMLKALHHADNPQCIMSDAEVTTTAITAALSFRGNFEQARAMLQGNRYIPDMLSKSRFNRRIHRLSGLFQILFELLGALWKDPNARPIYVIDSFPVAACDNYRIPRARLYQGRGLAWISGQQEALLLRPEDPSHGHGAGTAG